MCIENYRYYFWYHALQGTRIKNGAFGHYWHNERPVAYLHILLASFFQFLAGFDMPTGDTVGQLQYLTKFVICYRIYDMLEQNQMSDILSG